MKDECKIFILINYSDCEGMCEEAVRKYFFQSKFSLQAK